MDVEKVGQVGSFEWSPDSAEVIWSDEIWRIHAQQCLEARPPAGLELDDRLVYDAQLVGPERLSQRLAKRQPAAAAVPSS